MLIEIQGFRADCDWDGITQTSRTILGFSALDAARLTKLISDNDVVRLNLPEAAGCQYVSRLEKLGAIVHILKH